MAMKLEFVAFNKIENQSYRTRRDMGEIEELAASISDLGLLQPIGVDENYRLIFGYRRLYACRNILRWHTIPCVVLDIKSLLAGEYAENEFRKDFTVSERHAIAREIESELKEKERRGNPQLAADAANCTPGSDQEKGKSADIAAKRAGLGSAETFERATRVIEFGSEELINAMDKHEVTISTAATIAAQPKDDQARILALPKDERREVVRHIRQLQGKEKEKRQCDREFEIAYSIGEAVKVLANCYAAPADVWTAMSPEYRGGRDSFSDNVKRAIQYLVKLDKEHPNALRKPGVVNARAQLVAMREPDDSA